MSRITLFVLVVIVKDEELFDLIRSGSRRRPGHQDARVEVIVVFIRVDIIGQARIVNSVDVRSSGIPTRFGRGCGHDRGSRRRSLGIAHLLVPLRRVISLLPLLLLVVVVENKNLDGSGGNRRGRHRHRGVHRQVFGAGLLNSGLFHLDRLRYDQLAFLFLAVFQLCRGVARVPRRARLVDDHHLGW